MELRPVAIEIFLEKGRRKDAAGKAQEWMFGSPKPIIDVKLPVYTALEGYVQRALKISTDRARTKLVDDTDLFKMADQP